MGQRRWQKMSHTNWACRFARSAEQGRLWAVLTSALPSAARAPPPGGILSTDTTPLPPAPGYRPPGGGASDECRCGGATSSLAALPPLPCASPGWDASGCPPGPRRRGAGHARPEGTPAAMQIYIPTSTHPGFTSTSPTTRVRALAPEGPTLRSIFRGGPPGPGARRPKHKTPPCAPPLRAGRPTPRLAPSPRTAPTGTKTRRPPRPERPRQLAPTPRPPRGWLATACICVYGLPRAPRQLARRLMARIPSPAPACQLAPAPSPGRLRPFLPREPPRPAVTEGAPRPPPAGSRRAVLPKSTPPVNWHHRSVEPGQARRGSPAARITKSHTSVNWHVGLHARRSQGWPRARRASPPPVPRRCRGH